MDTFINFNGNLTDPLTPVVTAFNRSLRFGDGLFETMYWDGRKIILEAFHFDRLFSGLLILHFDLSQGFTRSFIAEEIRKLCLANRPGSPARIRLNVFREDGAQLLPMGNRPVFIIESSALPEAADRPLRLILFQKDRKSTGMLSNLKTNNYLLNMVALQFAQANQADDTILLNSSGNICESSSSNLFMMKKDILYTPALSEGCVAGTKRRELLQLLPGLGFRVSEQAVTPDMLFEMEEVFLSNAIRGIRSVASINDTHYVSENTSRMVQLLNQR